MVISTLSKIERTCETCGEKFYRFPSQLKDGRGRFCSKQCQYPNPRKVERICQTCSKVFYTKPCRIKKGSGKFCSHPCYADSLRGIPLPHSTLAERTCETCGRIFYTRPSRIKKGYGKFCSHPCWYQSPEFKAISSNFAELGKRERTPESKAKISKSLKGRYLGVNHPFFGQHHSVEAKAEMSQFHKGQWQDPEFVAKMMVSFHKKPTKPEKQLIGIFGKHFPQFEYNGDFSLGVTLQGLIPDFVNTNGKKEVIEVFGNYFHSPEVLGDRWQGSELGRIMAYNSLGYRCLVIWEHDLEEKSEGEIVNMVKTFTGGRKCHQ